MEVYPLSQPRAIIKNGNPADSRYTASKKLCY